MMTSVTLSVAAPVTEPTVALIRVWPWLNGTAEPPSTAATLGLLLRQIAELVTSRLLPSE
jgi:hypothetical protein